MTATDVRWMEDVDVAPWELRGLAVEFKHEGEVYRHGARYRGEANREAAKALIVEWARDRAGVSL